jgi:UDP-GlcNAc3NAcA epimerase
MKVVSVVGNRPQFIKAAPLAAALGKVSDHVLVHTGQHYDVELSQIFFDELGLRPPDHEIEAGSGSHAGQTAAMLVGLEPVLAGERADMVLVYGDTNSTLAGSLVAAKLQIPLGHVEAGLRSFDRAMPEEVNRVVADVLSDLRFCPSRTAVENLGAEGIREGVHLVGDVMVDVAKAFGPAARRSGAVERLGLEPGAYALVTVHRQSNTTDAAMPALVEVLEALDRPAIFPVHPRTQAGLEQAGLLKRAAAAATLTPPLGYLEFTALLMSAAVCLTDSGGVQKEAYLHRVPCITLRDTSEWVETVELGWNRLAGGLDAGAVTAALRQLSPPPDHPPLYGDGDAATRIAEVVASASVRRR